MCEYDSDSDPLYKESSSVKPSFQQTDISDYPELAVKQAADEIGPYVSEALLCKNEECPNDRHMGQVEYDGCCSIDCRKAIGVDHVNYGDSTLMMVTKKEASKINKKRARG